MNDTIFDYGSAPVAASGSGASYAAIIVVGAVVLVLLVAMLIVLRRALSRPSLHGLSAEEIKARWTEIEQVSNSSLMGAKMGIVEADKLLDGALKSLGMAGETMGERLKFAGYRYPELKHVWFAHRLRNQIVHETTFELPLSQAKSAMREYKKALKTIHVL